MFEEVLTQLLDRLVGEDKHFAASRLESEEATFGSIARWLDTDAPPLREIDLRHPEA